MNELKEIKEAVTKQSLNLNDIMKISFLSDDYKLTRQCVCGFKYKEMIEIKEHFDKNKICLQKIPETDMKRLVMITDIATLKNELLGSDNPDVDKTLTGIETLLKVVEEADFIYSSKYVIDINRINKYISKYFILLMGYVDKMVTNKTQRHRLEVCTAIWKRKFIDPNNL